MLRIEKRVSAKAETRVETVDKVPLTGRAAECRPLFTRITMHPVGARFIAPTDKNILI
jgi:hypothetical protein